MIEGKFLSGEEDLSIIKDIRSRVFCQEMGISAKAEEDGMDDRCMHAFVYAAGEPAACGRIMYDGWNFVISRVAVLPEYRRQKYGDFLVRLLIDKALQANAAEIQTEATEASLPFFESIGFVAEGQPFMLDGVTVFPMKLLTAALHSCCGCR